MKIIACILVLIAVVYAKEDLKVNNFCKKYTAMTIDNEWSEETSGPKHNELSKKYTVMTIDKVWDEKTSGPIDSNSVVNVKYSTHEETEGRGDFDVTFNFQVSKYVLFRYIPLPQAVHDQVGNAIDKLPNAQYLGNSNIRVNCMFKIIPGSQGHCMPPKGTLTERLVMKPIMNEVKKRLGPVAFLINGWFRIFVTGRTSFGKDAFCVQVDANLHVS